jgi:hypothetical protein
MLLHCVFADNHPALAGPRRSHVAHCAHTLNSDQTCHCCCCLQDNTPLLRPLVRRQLQRHGNRPLWVSEFGTGRGPLALAKQILKDLSTLRPTAWVYW